MNRVCVDAGLAIKFITPEEDSALAETLFAHWKANGTQMIAPPFAMAEIDSVLRQKITRGELTQAVADTTFRLACRLPVAFDTETNYRERAWEIAKEFQFPQAYDAAYLALAELNGCEFWTADKKLHERVKDKLKFVRLLGE
ncbi:MAG: type II toxin-antitoxin system VapC family toxin [Chloroflexi bacterium]|nr:type II toxin-antitoxin system VapC family toxin [Chloroflexota bacterium]